MQQQDGGFFLKTTIIAFVCYLVYNLSMKTQTTIRVEENNYHQAKEILAQVGLNYSQAVSVFNNMVVLNNGLPFEVKIPTKQTQSALNDLYSKKGESFDDVKALFDDLDD